MIGVIHTTKVKATRCGHIYSVVATKATPNGTAGFVGDLVSGEKELRDFALPSSGTKTNGGVVFIATPELMYGQDTTASGALRNFTNPAKAPMVAIPVEAGDELEISADLIEALSTDPAKGNFLKLKEDSGKLEEVNSGSEPTEQGFYAKINYVYPSFTSSYVDGAGTKVEKGYNLVHITIVKN